MRYDDYDFDNPNALSAQVRELAARAKVLAAVLQAAQPDLLRDSFAVEGFIRDLGDVALSCHLASEAAKNAAVRAVLP